MSVFPELLMWEQVSGANLSCGVGRMECDILRDLGPPPDMILSLPPPPVPPSLEELVSRLSSEALSRSSDAGSPGILFGTGAVGSSKDSLACNLCHWAKGDNVGFVELAQKGKLLERNIVNTFNELYKAR